MQTSRSLMSKEFGFSAAGLKNTLIDQVKSGRQIGELHMKKWHKAWTETQKQTKLRSN